MAHDEKGSTPVYEGLEGVRFTETRLSHVDGERGRLVIAGEDVEVLAARAPFEEVAVGLLRAAGEEPKDAARFAQELGLARREAHLRLGFLETALAASDAMDALRGAVALLEGDASVPTAMGTIAVTAAAWARRQQGLGPVEPDPAAPHGADYLRLVRGAAPSVPERRALDRYLVTVIDHGMNASTFAARVVASTGSDRVSAVTAALGALKGPLHGGAPGPVLDMLDAIAEPSRAEAWLRAELAAGRRIMGMGHRVYRVRDPRAAVLEGAVRLLEDQPSATTNLALARAVEDAATAILAEREGRRPLRANVEFYTAVLLDALGLPRALFTPTFAVARVVGWCAHAAEQRRRGRLIRPDARYVGVMPEESAPPRP